MEEMRSLLDSLMGKDRNELTSEKKEYSFKDENVCKFYLIDFCPHDLFPNTKSDIGRCKHIHSEVLKEQLENHEDKKYYTAKYEVKFMRALEKIIEGADAKIEKTKAKLKQMSLQTNVYSEKQAKIDSINEHICDLLKHAEEAGEKGDIEMATSFNNQITVLQKEIKRLNEEKSKSKDSTLKVCETCGAMQAAGEVVQRFENHLNGKQHLGFEKIRNTLQKLKEKTKEREEIFDQYRKHKRNDERHRDTKSNKSSYRKKENEKEEKEKEKKKDRTSRRRSHDDRRKHHDSRKYHEHNKRSSKREKYYKHDKDDIDFTKSKKRKYLSDERYNSSSGHSYSDERRYKRHSRR